MLMVCGCPQGGRWGQVHVDACGQGGQNHRFSCGHHKWM